MEMFLLVKSQWSLRERNFKKTAQKPLGEQVRMRGTKTSGNVMETWRRGVWKMEKTEPPFQGPVSLAVDAVGWKAVWGFPGDAWRGMLEKRAE